MRSPLSCRSCALLGRIVWRAELCDPRAIIEMARMAGCRLLTRSLPVLTIVMTPYVEVSRRYFLDTGTRFSRPLIWAMGAIKLAASRVNGELGLLDGEVASAIGKASEEVMGGRWDQEIVVDVFGTGSGTGLNMNINEVIARRASELAGREVHPNDHVNLGQSSNDVVPSAIRIAAYSEVMGRLVPALERLRGELDRLGAKFGGVIRPGRTHLRDALPTTFGHFFGSYSEELRRIGELIRVVSDQLLDIPLGGTAVGTGLNTHPAFPSRALHHLRQITSIPVREDAVKSRSMRLVSDLVNVGGVLRTLAIDLHRLSQDLRLMFSGPATGFNEVNLRIELAGSSIMPGKVNPITQEAVQMAASHVIGLDSSLASSGILGELELSMGIPLAGWTLVRMVRLLGEAMTKLATSLEGMEVNEGRCEELAMSSRALITILTPVIGYDRASRLYAELEKGRKMKEVLREMGIDERRVMEILSREKLVSPGFPALG